MLKKIIFPIVVFIAGRPILQFFFETLNFISLIGMNHGIGVGNIETSGEKKALKYIKKNLTKSNTIAKRNFVLFDVGANIGSYSKEIIKIFDLEKYSLFSFEPSLYTFNILSKNIKTNNNIRLINIGLSNIAQKLTLYNDFLGCGDSSVIKRNLESINRDFNLSEEINLTTLDIFATENEIDQIDLLKIDVEGHELNVLEGAANFLRNRKIKFIQFEFGGTNIDAHTNFKDFFYLLKPDFKIYRILSHGLREIKTYDEKQEIYLGVNYLAELV